MRWWKGGRLSSGQVAGWVDLDAAPGAGAVGDLFLRQVRISRRPPYNQNDTQRRSEKLIGSSYRLIRLVGSGKSAGAESDVS